jgi:hypothetical protein
MILGILSSCQDMEKVNVDPNNPSYMQSNMLMAGTTKRIIDYIHDNWFGGRQCLVYSQFWSQRSYTEEDRYQIRESVNNNYFIYFYQAIAGFDKIIELNTGESADEMSAFGDNNNQIAACKIMKAWVFLVATDTWGSIPYSEASKLAQEIFYPKYDDQKDIYAALIQELNEAIAMINEESPAFNGGDNIYNGDASKWKKFANSLKCRIAIHMSKVDSNWKTYINEAVSSGVFQSNDDNALYHYSSANPNQSHFWRAIFVDSRNDFTVSRPFVDILKGQKDTLNNKTHPWEGVVDPRLAIYTTPRDGKYIGLPYGIKSSEQTSVMRNTAPTWNVDPPLAIHPDFAVPLMTYAEMQFILSEYNGFSATEYKEGIKASLEHWSAQNGTSLDAAEIDAYIGAVSKNVNPETVSLQKYIDLYMNGTEAWTEYRRTGYPIQLIHPNEISCLDAEGNELRFEPLSDTKGGIICRVKYPTNESTLNNKNFLEAISKLQGGDNNYYSKMFWDVRSSENPYPANK